LAPAPLSEILPIDSGDLVERDGHDADLDRSKPGAFHDLEPELLDLLGPALASITGLADDLAQAIGHPT
jgi:hypothetical protein